MKETIKPGLVPSDKQARDHLIHSLRLMGASPAKIAVTLNVALTTVKNVLRRGVC